MTAKGPLRKVVREFSKERRNAYSMVVFDHYEELECGHTMRPRSDIYGEYFSERRRCEQCAAEHGVEPTRSNVGEKPAVVKQSKGGSPA